MKCNHVSSIDDRVAEGQSIFQIEIKHFTF